MRILFYVLFTIFVFTFNTQRVVAVEISSVSSAKFHSRHTIIEENNRVKILKKFLQEQNSPLTDSAIDFINFADLYNLDWKLVVAISGLESSFGQYIPHNSYNGWGWGVYGDNVINFSSWKEGIKTVSQGLRENYINKWGANDIYAIGRIYAASPTWAIRVEGIMNRVGEFALSNSRDTLSLSL